MKIAIIGHLKFPIAKPFSGGLEMFTHALVSRLSDRGHDVTLFASGDSDPDLPVTPILPKSTIGESETLFGLQDHAFIEAREDEAYETLMAGLLDSSFDVIHNNSISPIPLQFAPLIGHRMVTTLHVPVLPRLREMIRNRSAATCGRFINISRSNARVWQHLLPQQQIVHNGVDTSFWKSCDQPSNGRAVWFGRILPDKGTHYAIEAAHRAGLSIDVVGPIANEEYFQNHVRTKFSSDDRYLGHQDHKDLCQIIGEASVAIVTPCWSEPFGLVVPEALACGTPVAAFDRGAMAELIPSSVGRVVTPGNVTALANAIRECLDLRGEDCRRHAEDCFSIESMIDRYEHAYDAAPLRAVA